MNILFITANRLGDAVLSTGLLDALGRRYPRARFTVACGPVAASLFAPDPRCVRVITVEKRRYDAHWLSLWRECVGTRWDLVIDLRGSGVSFFLWARRRRIMRGGRRNGLRIGHLGAVLNLDPPPLPVVWTTPGQDELAREALPDVARYLALGPTANWDGKIWPAEHFIELARARPDLIPVLFYGPGTDEERRASPVRAALPHAIDLGGDRPLGEVAALLRRCALFVGNDSGLMHLAAAAGVPTLGLFGPSRVSEYAPSGICARAVIAPGPEGQAPIAGLDIATVLASADEMCPARM